MIAGMARRVRVDVPGGRYHMRSGGNERRAIFQNHRARAHRLELLEELPQRFGAQLPSSVNATLRTRCEIGMGDRWPNSELSEPLLSVLLKGDDPSAVSAEELDRKLGPLWKPAVRACV